MLPPRYPKSPRESSNQLPTSPSIPYPNNQRRFSNSQQKYRNSNNFNSIQSCSRVSKYEHFRTPQQKRKALGKRKYINQLAYLDYEEKYIEIHTKYTLASRMTVMKKIKAKNQMAEFIEEEQQEELGFEELMDYKYGRQSNNENFFFQKNQLINEYQFCRECDSIHNDHPEVHDKVCKDKVFSSQQYDRRNDRYVYLSLQRIQYSLKPTSGQEYQTLKEIIKNLIRIEEKSFTSVNNRLQVQSTELQKQLRFLYELYKVNSSDSILRDIAEKIMVRFYKRVIN